MSARDAAYWAARWAALPDPYATMTPTQRAALPLTPALARANQALLAAWADLAYHEAMNRPRKRGTRVPPATTTNR